MEVTKVILFIFVYAFEMLISLSFFSSIYERKKSITYTMLIGLLLFIPSSLVFNLLNNKVINLTVFFLINAAFSFLCYNVSIKSAIIQSVLLDALMFSSEMIIIFLFSAAFNLETNIYETNLNYLLVMLLICKTLYFILSQIMVVIIKHIEHKSINSNKFLPLFIFPALTIVSSIIFLLISLRNDVGNSIKIAIAITSAFYVIACIFIFMYFQTLENNEAELNELKAIEQKQEIDQTYMSILEQNNKDLKIFTHNIKNHLEQISNLSDNPEIKEYVGKLYGTVNQYSYAGISDNRVLDIIISKYNTLCQSKNIRIAIDTKTANLSFVENTDLSTILNNLLDNAVESAERSNGRKINVSIFSKSNSMQVLKISNSCDIPPIVEKQKLITSKSNKELHGLGITSVSKTVKKYDGLLDWSYDDKNNIFETTVIFSI